MDPHFFEKILIKYLFINKDARDKIIPFLTPKVFDEYKNVKIIGRILHYIERFNKFPTVTEMKVDIEEEDVYNHLAEIVKIDTSEYDEQFLISEVEEFFKKKLILESIAETAENLNNGDITKISNAPDQLRDALAFSFDTKIGLDLFDEEERAYDFLHNRDRIIPTFLKSLNKYIEGGFHEKSLFLFMAETNLGKSLIMSSLATDCTLLNHNVLYVTCEMSEEKISERIMANMFNVPMEGLKLITRDRFYEKFRGIKERTQKKILIKEYPPRAINTNHMRNLIKELNNKKKFVPDIIFVDYLGLMLPTKSTKNDNSYVEVKRISEELRALAVELGIPIVSAVQTNRKGFGSSGIDLTDISDSIGTAATADVIVGVTQSEELREQGKYNWTILKNRYGINKQSVKISVDYSKMRIYESDEDNQNTNNHKPSEKEKVDKAVNEVDNIMTRDRKRKVSKVIQFE